MMKQEALQPGFHGFTELVILKVNKPTFDSRAPDNLVRAGAPGAQGPGEGRGEGCGSLCRHHGWRPPH